MNADQYFRNAEDCIRAADEFRKKGLGKSQRMMLDQADAWMRMAVQLAQTEAAYRQRWVAEG